MPRACVLFFSDKERKKYFILSKKIYEIVVKMQLHFYMSRYICHASSS